MNLFDLSGRTALVTGSNRGIGKAILTGLAQQGANVVIHCASNVQQARALADELAPLGVRTCAVQADLAEADAPHRLFDAVMQHFEQVDILVLNASMQINHAWDEITHEEFAQQMAVNVRASLDLIRLFLPGMVAQGWGRVLTVGSVQQAKPHPRTLVYAASKEAQMSIVRNLARQYAARGITINNLAPGFIATDRNAQAMANADYIEQLLTERVPAGVVGQPEDCVGAALLLCSDAGKYITGINLLVDGGMHL
jgi:glucose 1-dehydrogenase